MHNETAEITIENLKAKLKHYYPANFQQLMDAFDLGKGRARRSETCQRQAVYNSSCRGGGYPCGSRSGRARHLRRLVA